MITKVSLADKLSRIDRAWSPHIVGELNGQHVKLARLEGEFIWHHHEHEDELFLVLSGALRLDMRDGSVTLLPGEMIVVPRGVEHRPVAEPGTEVLLFEPAGTLNTGHVTDDARTVRDPKRL